MLKKLLQESTKLRLELQYIQTHFMSNGLIKMLMSLYKITHGKLWDIKTCMKLELELSTAEENLKIKMMEPEVLLITKQKLVLLKSIS